MSDLFMIYYVNVETGAEYYIVGNGVRRWHEDKKKYVRVDHIKPCDLAHYPYVGKIRK